MIKVKTDKVKHAILLQLCYLRFAWQCFPTPAISSTSKRAFSSFGMHLWQKVCSSEDLASLFCFCFSIIGDISNFRNDNIVSRLVCFLHETVTVHRLVGDCSKDKRSKILTTT